MCDHAADCLGAFVFLLGALPIVGGFAAGAAVIARARRVARGIVADAQREADAKLARAASIEVGAARVSAAVASLRERTRRA